jgi:hypothetical protein
MIAATTASGKLRLSARTCRHGHFHVRRFAAVWVTPTVGAVTRSHVVPKIRWSVLIEAGQQLVAMLF